MTKILLYPFTLLYGFVVYIRNRLYDLNLFKSHEFDVPVISIGNITVGGTGKTPHVEYLIGLLKDSFEVAALSRGYKRKTKGFRWVEADSKVAEVGDEPLQVKKKFPDVKVSVCENRVAGAEKLLDKNQENIPDVLLLDDAFQHRRIVAGINILLIDYNRPVKEDSLLPAGRLREPAGQMKRANIIIFTKCPGEITPIMRRIIQKQVRLKPYQELFFTTLQYDSLIPVFEGRKFKNNFEENSKVLVITGIASPILIYQYLEKQFGQLETLAFPDHHNYSPADIQKINRKFGKINAENKLIVTTEKDAVRFREMEENLDEQFKQLLYYLPVKVRFLDEEGKLFNKKILAYVGENKSNRKIYQKKNQRRS